MGDLFNIPVLLLIVSLILIFVLLAYILKSKEKTQLQKIFCVDLICVLIISIGVILQHTFATLTNVNPIYFENFIYIGTCFLPVSIYFTGLVFEKTKLTFKKYYLLLFVVPILSLIIIWTNQYHHLFYKTYSSDINSTVYGPYFRVHTIYTYLLLLIGIVRMLQSTAKNSGFFSKQSLLIVFGISIPLVTNILGTLQVIPMTVFITPISFTFTMLFFALAIFKFKFLGIAPIALQTIVNRISDSFVVLNENFIITDFNSTLLKTFKITDADIREKNVLKLIEIQKYYDLDKDKLEKILNQVKNTTDTITLEKHAKNLNKYFLIEINTLYNKDSFLGILILLKDITQHKNDMETIKSNQDMLMEQERLASLGQLIGGISHNLKTPIMSISGAAEGLTDLINEYDASIGDPEVTNDDNHAIANDMRDWIEKIHSYTSYMSDIITAVKGQAVTLSESEQDTFTIDELVKRVNILMKHELQDAHVQLNINLNNLDNVELHGNVNSLVQVINNLVTNAIQSYRGEVGKSIDLIAMKTGNQLSFSIEDHGCGIPQDVQDKLFKEMITTKGKNGTGLGMFMSYSTIKGKFNGDMNFVSEENKGTKFNITLPIS